ncbi:histidinol-phosphatase HisJ [Leuconostoc falkenbergense]|uniref:histidinol-phosphatase HisJ n=1 Tax=Leuconostoc falkenbergense TaxID=2766470 RepID=UPI0021AA3DA9|nr:histidinol-phosphatase HisJ [Leuconostoc falkenbergense]MCT4379379.1 histidinol-phosphatase HisJ [Leuconostoc falkenbergense]MDV8951100.1 histidinol-phosphatase HisJ [Leuconostoc falkenbergense]
MLKKDGHTHIPNLIDHKNNDNLDDLIERAISLGFKEYTIAATAPLPDESNVNRSQLGLTSDDLTTYKLAVDRVADKYQNQILIKRAFEINYFSDYENQMRRFLRSQAEWVDEVILSVHFMPDDMGILHRIDDNVDSISRYFAETLTAPQVFYQRYFALMAQSVEAIIGVNKPIRIADFGIIKRFQQALNLPDFDDSIYKQIGDIFQMMATRDYQLEINAAGFNDVGYGDTYPALDVAASAFDMGIDVVYSSHAQSVSEVGQFFNEIEEVIK